MIILTSEDVAQLLPMRVAIEVIDTTMKMVSKGDAELPLRSAIPVGGANKMGIMPGAIMSADNSCFGVKLLSLFPDNSKRGLSSHLGAYVLFDADTGEARAMMDASLLTAVRTAAASGVATRALAREDASALTIIGYGEQAEHHLDAICAVRDIATVHIVGRDAAKAEAFCKTALPAGGIYCGNRCAIRCRAGRYHLYGDVLPHADLTPRVVARRVSRQRGRFVCSYHAGSGRRSCPKYINLGGLSSLHACTGRGGCGFDRLR
jgi:ornithine cyclodeaminase/alanine dehydrogenase-like protein (mu-crystallin family)